ncbi:hypothetical protein X798_00052 [Onchocerca flexuosa]|uniref:Uncharacterized protein n=1 Tax=Onchocerca flexuosa TaxID=387005 RepID=A0A238C4M6_9BILA|nr:hypothetical protein X798_00052 [Onchocerca flexuosa]
MEIGGSMERSDHMAKLATEEIDIDRSSRSFIGEPDEDNDLAVESYAVKRSSTRWSSHRNTVVRTGSESRVKARTEGGGGGESIISMIGMEGLIPIVGRSSQLSRQELNGRDRVHDS